MDEIARCLRNKSQCGPKELRSLSEQLALNCKKSISSEWDVSLAGNTAKIEPPLDNP